MSRRNKPQSTTAQRNWKYFVACLALITAAICSGLLVLKAIGALDLPGCGQGSPCAQLASSKWGKVPALGLSTAGLGLAYFCSMLLAWLIWRGRMTKAWVRLALLGGAASLLLTGVMVSMGSLCKYCICAHIANAVFIVIVVGARLGRGILREVSPQRRVAWNQLALSGVATVFLGLAIHAVESGGAAKARERHEARLQESLKKVVESQPDPPPMPIRETPDIAPKQTDAGLPVTSRGFEGRYRLGPESASIRIVMLTDYQCPDCKKLEAQLRRVLAMNHSLAVSIKFFPLSTVCNPNLTQDMHPDACWAAAAAFAAGELGGRDAFWAMHHWLFDRGGLITREALADQARTLGVDPVRLLAIVDDPATMKEVRKDIDEGIALGLTQTPMIFINGVELKGWIAPDALVRAVESVAKTNPEPRTSLGDRPPLADERYLADWDAMPRREISARILARATGPADAPVTIVLVGDYAEPGTVEADANVRALLRSHGEVVRYAFAHFPMNQACNSSVPFTKFETSCLSARAAQGALDVGGTDAFWRAHGWLMGHGAGLSPADFALGASAVGVEPGAWIASMTSDRVEEAIQADAREVLALGLTSIPAVYINGKLAANWKTRSENLLPRLVERARRESSRGE